MNRKDRIKLSFTRNWKLPGKERLSSWLEPSKRQISLFKDGIVWLSDEDIAIYTNADNFIERSILSGGTYEDDIAKVIKISLKPGDVALDIGANIGLQSLRMSQCVGLGGKVYSFEPLGYLQEKFEKNMLLNCVSNVTLFPCALSDIEEEAVFKIDSKTWNQGSFSLIGNQDTGNETQQVYIKIADDLPEIQSLKTINLVKIDVEGFEYHVLRGLKQTLIKHRPRIIFEYDDDYWDRTKQLIKDCYEFLKSLNYAIYQITPVGCELITKAEDILDGNLFCIHARANNG